MMRAGRRIVLALYLIGAGSFSGLTGITRGGEPLDDRLGIRTTLLFLLIRSDIQAELGLEPAQVADVNRAAKELYRKALGLKGRSDKGAVAARRAIDEEEGHWLSSHLNPKQRDRLGQIDLQWEGASALLSRPIVADYLGLTAAQQENVKRIVVRAQAQRPRPGPWTYDEHLELTRKAISLLTEKQKQQWVHVLGPPCRFAIVIAPPAQATPSAGGGKPGQPGGQR